MAFRNSGGFVVPSVVHWKVGHYAALVRKAGGLYELQDPTFGNTTWASKEALQAEASGYFLVASGPLPPGWRAVNAAEGATVWGKGQTGGNDPQHIAKNDIGTGGSCPATGMATAKVHLMEVNLHLGDNPLGYTPPVGPKVKFALDYNLRDAFQPANFNYGNLGAQWTSDWFTYITDNPANLVADVNLYVAGGGQRTYTGFNTNTQSYRYQQYDNNLLTRTSTNPIVYQLLSGDGSKMIFGQSDGSSGSSRNIFLTQAINPQGNALTFSYNTNLCLVAVQDAIGQVTTLTYGLQGTNWGPVQDEHLLPADPYKLTGVTDPFGRTATFNYEPQVVQVVQQYANGQLVSTFTTYTWGLASDTDVIGITSQFGYEAVTTFVMTNGGTVTTSFINFVNSLTTPYGTTFFNGVDNGNTRTMDIVYPDASRERIEYYQANVFDTNLTRFQSDPALSVPTGMNTDNNFLLERNTYYWDRNASALALGDLSKARLYHFCHTESGTATSGALESMKPPLEGRIWFDYAGQNGSPEYIGSNTLPLHVGRVLDDGSTQLYTCAYNPFGHVTNYVDPVGRTLSLIYDTNGIDLLEVRQTRLGQNELLARITYNSQHRPLTATDAAGQTTTYACNARGQLVRVTDAKNEITTFTYDTNGYLLSIVGPLPGTNDVVSATYDAYGRIRTTTDESGYTVTFDYDNLDRVTGVTHPDGTFSQFTYNRLDCAAFQDRAGRQTMFAHDNMRQLTATTDPLGRVTHYEWCRCGAPKSVIDPMGRKTSWLTDVQGRRTAKQYPDGSQVQYFYENTTGRLQQMIDEKQQFTVYTYNADNTPNSIVYAHTAVPTPNVTYAYDPNYRRVVSMTDGIGTTTYNYIPVTTPPVLGAGGLGRVEGPLANETIAYTYDQLGRVVQTSIDGVLSTRAFDAAGRIISASNALGSFVYSYDGASDRLLLETDPNGQRASASYGSNLQDFALQHLTYAVGVSSVSQFTYGRDIPRMQITNWSQQAGAQSPSVFTFGYDAVNQLLSAAVTNSGAHVNGYAYSYDPSANRLSELVGGATATSSFNALNQLSTTANAAADFRTNQWDSQHRLAIVNAGNLQTMFGYDGASRLAYIQQLQNGAQMSFRRFVWCGGRICEERDATGTVITKRYFPQGVLLQTGTNSSPYYYTRDHLGSIRELTDAGGNVRARYSYDPYGRKTKLGGDVEADFGFAGMFWSPEANLALTRFRAYDPNLGRWLSRDPLNNAELRQGPNLYAYVHNEPVGHIDRLGLLSGEQVAEVGVAVGTGVTVVQTVFIPAFNTVQAGCLQDPPLCIQAGLMAAATGGAAFAAAGPALEDIEADCTVAGAEAPAVAQAAETEAGPGTVTQATLPPPPPTPPPPVVAAPSGPGLNTAVKPFANTQIPGLADTIVPDEAAATANEQESFRWFEDMMMATSDYRMRLVVPTPNGYDWEAVFAHARMISQMQDLLFFPLGK
jgi:RHS repeat-associated protein